MRLPPPCEGQTSSLLIKGNIMFMESTIFFDAKDDITISVHESSAESGSFFVKIEQVKAGMTLDKTQSLYSNQAINVLMSRDHLLQLLHKVDMSL